MHTYQFVIGPKATTITGDTLTIQLNNSSVLSYDSKLPVRSIEDSKQNKWFLVGWAFQTVESFPSPEQQIATQNTKDIPSVSKDWTGRWLLIGNDTIHMDAGGSLGCLYTMADGELWVSSSPALLKNKHKKGLKAAPKIKHAQGMDFYPGPHTKYESIYRLLPSQSLRINNNQIKINHKPPITEMNFKSYEDILGFAEECLITTLKNIAKEENNIWLPLTGGYDSRLILSAVYKSGIDVTIFTYDKPYLDITKADRVLPKRLAAELGFEHKKIKRDSFSEKRVKEFDAHTAGMIPGSDRVYHAYGQLEQVPKSAFILRGGMFEIGKCFYYKRLPLQQKNAEYIQKAFKFDSHHKNSSAHYDGIKDWLQWVEDFPHENLDWRDRFYLEQRIGSWLSSVEQGLDLAWPKRAHAANCHNLISAFLEIPLEIREKERHYVDLIDRMAPSLLNYPFNPKDAFFKRAVRKLKKEFVR